MLARAEKGNDMTLSTFARGLAGAAFACIGAGATQAETYVYGGLSYGSADYGYTYEIASSETEFSHQGVGAFLGMGRSFASRGSLTFGGEIDIAAGAWASDVELVSTTPCIIPGDACEGSVDALMTVRGTVAFEQAGWTPFLTAGLAVGKVSGSADEGACGVPCEFDETRTGWVVGAGFTRPLTERFDLRVDYLYTDLGKPEFTAPDSVTSAAIVFQQLRIGAQMAF